MNLRKLEILLAKKYLNMVIYSHILDCRSHLFIREAKVLAALDGMLSYITLENKIKNSISLHQDSEKKDRRSVLNKIENNNLKLSKRLISTNAFSYIYSIFKRLFLINISRCWW